MSSAHQTIKVLSKAYDIKCPAGKEEQLQLALDKLLRVLASNKRKMKGLSDVEQLLVAALNISHELIELQQHQKAKNTRFAKFVTELETPAPIE